MAGKRLADGKDVFRDYAEAYDLLYGDKDYEKECDFLELVFSRYASGPVRGILDLGCGTGGHAIPMACRGYEVSGVDRSAEMLRMARAKARQRGVKVPFVRGDIAEVELGKVFDAVVALFNVIGYQTRNDRVHRMLEMAETHLRPGGLLVFDFWFGPSALREGPQARIKEASEGDLSVLRFSQPSLVPEENRVDVFYRVLCIQGQKVVSDIRERHEVRFFFLPELREFLGRHHLKILHVCEWLRLEREPGRTDWNACLVACKE